MSNKVSGWFIYWEHDLIHKKTPENEWERLILIEKNRQPNRTKGIEDFIQKYYISTMYSSEKVELASPRSRIEKAKTLDYLNVRHYDMPNGVLRLTCGNNPCIIAEYRKNVLVSKESYRAWFPN